MATRRAVEVIFPWTDPCETLNVRLETSLRVVACLFDSITDTFIEEHASRESRAYANMATPDRNRLLNGRNPVEEMIATKERLTATYPRLKADADVRQLLNHIANMSECEYWESQCRNPHAVQGPTRSASIAIANSREEALDIYETVRADLEKKSTRVLLNVANAIRLKLRAVESLLGFWNLSYRQLPRQNQEIRSSRPDNVPRTTSNAATIIAITTVVTFATFIPLGFAWFYAQGTHGTPFDMDFWFLIQNSTMQLLSIFITIYPIQKIMKLSRRLWYWALFFTIIGFICMVGSIPMYLFLPTFWSGFASFAGIVAQVSISVQLVLLTISQSQYVKQA
ncbi:hypothetical protein B0T24DRAFT_324273 [Lasiosphaeria ovina]|uniref:Uncharacterized protein n=1 Tax=Lasiosphaeria ovina TaxID=92902 RepID=A0AAE0N633_9PEZI|nr:hypothetical protein B0T24DRAFT_324273 [Lasiosphaeria ovina]